MSEMDTKSNVEELAKTCMVGFKSSWVLFHNGTVVIAPGTTNDADAKEAAIALLKENGPVYVGTPHGDFNVSKCQASPGWVVTSHHDQIITFVKHSQFGDEVNDIMVGFFGRNCRDLDSKELQVTHVYIEPSNN